MTTLKLGSFLAAACLLAAPVICSAQVRVNGYTKSNGTYVSPYVRSAPDNNPTNNYSYPGNTNPYTGRQATGNPNTYLNGYGTRGGSSTKSPYSIGR